MRRMEVEVVGPLIGLEEERPAHSERRQSAAENRPVVRIQGEQQCVASAYLICHHVQQMLIDNCQSSMVQYRTAHDTKNTVEANQGRARRAEAEATGPIGN